MPNEFYLLNNSVVFRIGYEMEQNGAKIRVNLVE